MSRDVNKVYAGLLVIGGMALGLVLYRAALDSNQLWWLPAIMVLIAFLYGITVLLQRWSIARQLAKIPDAHGPYTWTISTDGFRSADH